MNDDPDLKKKVDENWKEAVHKEMPLESSRNAMPDEVTFSLFLTGLVMEALVALSEVEHPVIHKKEFNGPHAKFVIDTLTMLQDKTKNNLAKEESDMLESALYDLRMRYIHKMKELGGGSEV